MKTRIETVTLICSDIFWGFFSLRLGNKTPRLNKKNIFVLFFFFTVKLFVFIALMIFYNYLPEAASIAVDAEEG